MFALIDLHVAEGEIVAFLGPNGAGKTTTIEILEGFRKRDGGSVRVLGVDPDTAPLDKLSGGRKRRLDLAQALVGNPDPVAVENWLVIAAWGAVAALVAIRGFRWIPRR